MRMSYSLISMVVLSAVGTLVGSSYAEIDHESIVGVWLFDEGRDDAAEDSSGNGHNGKILGNVKWTDSKFGKALEFPGVSGNFVSIPDEEDLNLVTWSITTWIKIEEVKGSECHVVIKEEPGNVRNYGIIVKPGFAYPTFTSGPGVWKNIAGKTPVTDDEWRHIAATYDKTLERLYVDGVLDVQIGFTDIPDTTPGPLGIGSGGTKGDVGPVIGVIDEVAVFNVALTEDDINDIMNSGLEMALGITAVSSAGKLALTWAKIKVSG